MTTPVTVTDPMKIAVRCDECKRVVAYKLCTGGGRLQLKCPKCGCEIVVDLSLRRAKYPIFNRVAKVPLSIPMR